MKKESGVIQRSYGKDGRTKRADAYPLEPKRSKLKRIVDKLNYLLGVQDIASTKAIADDNMQLAKIEYKLDQLIALHNTKGSKSSGREQSKKPSGLDSGLGGSPSVCTGTSSVDDSTASTPSEPAKPKRATNSKRKTGHDIVNTDTAK
ncbi:MAG: hypothetical protein FWD76_01875 [Firmicutes bacterium]|nr:hypothetical protein [Bacillota bacterium]